MPRASSGAARRRKTNRLLKRAKGFQLGGQQYKTAKTKLMKAGMYSFFGRKIKKRDYRSMWIVRLNAACDLNGISYNRFMEGLRVAEVGLNRKAMSELALSDEKTFAQIVGQAKDGLEIKKQVIKACDDRKIGFNRFMEGLRKAKRETSVKALAEILKSDAKKFDELVAAAKAGP